MSLANATRQPARSNPIRIKPMPAKNSAKFIPDDLFKFFAISNIYCQKLAIIACNTQLKSDALGIERRVGVDEANGFGRQLIAQDVQVVAEEKLIHPRFGLTVGAVDGKENGPLLARRPVDFNLIPARIAHAHESTRWTRWISIWFTARVP
jgi:hypothetical protein